MLKYFGLQRIRKDHANAITKGDPAFPETGDLTIREENKFSIIFFIVITLVSGVGVIIIYAISQGCLTCVTGPKFLSIFGILSILAMSSSILGTLVGFIFGLPKTPASVDQDSIGANNNLEEISDWLTKIIVGVSLVQLNQIAGYIEQVGIRISAGLGNVSGSFVFSISTLIFYSIGGFFLGYLWSRIYLPKILKTSLEEGLRKVRKELREQKEQMKEKEEELKDVMNVKEQQKELINAVDLIKLKADSRDSAYFKPENFSETKLVELIEQIIKVFEKGEVGSLFDKIITACYGMQYYEMINNLTDKFKSRIEINYKTWSDVAVTNMVLYNASLNEMYKERVEEALKKVRKHLVDDGVSYAIEIYLSLIELKKDPKTEASAKNNIKTILDDMKSRSDITSWEAVRYFNANEGSPVWSSYNKTLREIFPEEYQNIQERSAAYDKTSSSKIK